MDAPLCNYCGKPAQFITGRQLYPRRSDLFTKLFWRCDPCDAHVGCHAKGSFRTENGERIEHRGDEPYGCLANAELRNLKRMCHAGFDKWWETEDAWRKCPAYTPGAKYAGRRRQLAYAWLAQQMSLPPEETHFGKFDEERCLRALEIIKQWTP